MHDLHRHFSGSISISTISKLVGMDYDHVSKIMTYNENDDRNYESFFTKFDILNKIEWDYKKIELAIEDVIWGIKRESINYVEIKFSIQKYLKLFNHNVIEAICWFSHAFENYASKWGIEYDLVLSLTYESNKELQTKIANSIYSDKVSECISGIDLVGNENYYEREFYKPIMEAWKNAGKICMAHAGEINNINNVKSVIHDLKVDRVCHGLACINDLELIKMAHDNDVVFDIGLTSNHLTGVADISDHPITFMVNNGCHVTIGTDDPVIFNTTLSDEYKLLDNLVNNDQLQQIIKNSIKFSIRNLIKNK